MTRGVPYDHQLEYIESTGSQWIDTGIKPKLTTKARMKVCNKVWTGDVIFGFTPPSTVSSWDDNDWRIFNYSNTVYFDMLGGARINGSTFRAGEWRELEIGNYYVKDLVTGSTLISGTTRTDSPAYASNTYTLTLNKAGHNGAMSSNKWAYVKIYDGDTLVQDLIPVSVNGVAKMYDRVTGAFPKHYGTFVAGPVASTPLMGVHMYGESDYWFWPKKLVPMPGGNPTKIMNLDQDPGLGVWAYRIATNGYAGGEIPSSSIFSFTDKSVSCENVGGYAVCVCRKFEPGTYTMTAYRDIIGYIYALEYTPSGTGHVISGNKMTVISGNNAAGKFVGRFTVSQGAITVLMFGSAQRGYQIDPGPCTFTDVHINDYIE